MNSINFFDHTIDIFSTFGIFLLGIFLINQIANFFYYIFFGKLILPDQETVLE